MQVCGIIIEMLTQINTSTIDFLKGSPLIQGKSMVRPIFCIIHIVIYTQSHVIHI